MCVPNVDEFRKHANIIVLILTSCDAKFHMNPSRVNG